MESLTTLILAAGKGTRMKSDLAKVLHPINGRPMVHYVIDLAGNIGSKRIILVIGHQKEKVREACRDLPVEFVVQEEQLGTGHAVRMAEDLLKNEPGDILVLSGDVPMLTEETLTDLVDSHRRNEAIASLLTAELDDPTGYGRVIRNDQGHVAKIVEHKDAGEEERKIQEINVGIYLFKPQPLFETLREIRSDNVQGEFYLPDVVKIYVDRGEKVVAETTDDFDETRGINTVEQLRQAETILRKRRLKNS